MDKEDIALAVARACLAGPVDLLSIRERCSKTLLGETQWLVKLTHELMAFSRSLIEARDVERLAALVAKNPIFDDWEASRDIYPAGFFVFEPRMLDAPHELGRLRFPDVSSPGNLARWLGLSIAELDWLADIGSWRQGSPSALCHYRYRWIAKRSGGLRLLEIPKSRLHKIQRKILREILDQVPLHGAAHGCVRERSIFSNASLHSNRQALIRIDLNSFFTSVRYSRVQAIFRTLGFPSASARYLAALTTNATPVAVLDAAPYEDTHRARSFELGSLNSRHLPQGAPTSAALANLAAWRLDFRLEQAAQASDLRYTRYVDDLFFSNAELAPGRARRLADMVYGIVLDAGFVPNFRKTRFMRRSVCQRVTGLTVNSHPNMRRSEFDALKAILNNCVRHGPEGQNRAGLADFRSHLLGRIAFCEQANAGRGKKLRAMFEAIGWPPREHSTVASSATAPLQGNVDGRGS